MSKVLLTAAMLLSVATSVADASFVRLDSSTPVCFAEDVTAASEIVVIEYNRPSVTNSNDVVVAIKATSPYSKSIVYEGSIRAGTGSLTFKPVSTESGEYDICLSISSEAAKKLAEMKSFVDVGVIIDHHSRHIPLTKPDKALTASRTKVGKGSAVMTFTDTDGNQMETLRSVDFLERLKKLLENIEHATSDIDTEVEYISARGTRMRQTSEALFSRVWTFATLTMIAMIAVGYMQYNFLVGFLKQKKLV